MHSLTPSLLLLEHVETFSSSGEVLAGISTACTSVVSVAWVRQQVSSSLAPILFGLRERLQGKGDEERLSAWI